MINCLSFIKLSIIFIYVLTSKAPAQEFNNITNHISSTTKDTKHAFYIEALGSSNGLLTIFYERHVKDYKNNKLSIAGGIGIINLNDKGDRTTLVAMGLWNTNRSGNWHLEFGTGITYKLDYYQNNEQDSDYFDHKFDIPIRAGFNYSKPTGGLLVKVAFTPNISLYSFKGLEGIETVLCLIGFSMGYAF